MNILPFFDPTLDGNVEMSNVIPPTPGPVSRRATPGASMTEENPHEKLVPVYVEPKVYLIENINSNFLVLLLIYRTNGKSCQRNLILPLLQIFRLKFLSNFLLRCSIMISISRKFIQNFKRLQFFYFFCAVPLWLICVVLINTWFLLALVETYWQLTVWFELFNLFSDKAKYSNAYLKKPETINLK